MTAHILSQTDEPVEIRLEENEKKDILDGLVNHLKSSNITYGTSTFYEEQNKYMYPVFITLKAMGVHPPSDWFLSVLSRKPLIADYTIRTEAKQQALILDSPQEVGGE